MKSLPWPPALPRLRLLWVAVCAAVVAWGPAAVAVGQSVWELRPYRVELWVAFGSAPGLTPRLQADLPGDVVERIDGLVGARWNVTRKPAPVALRRAMTRAIEEVTIESLPKESFDYDKVMLLAVLPAVDGYRVAARELDVRTLLWSTTVSRPVRQLGKLRDTALGVLFETFRPLARIESVAKKQVGLRLKASGLPSRKGAPALVKPGDVFSPAVRYNDREGKLRKDKQGNVIRPKRIDWTFLTVEKTTGMQLTCQLHTGYRTPLSSRRRGRFEQLALAVVPPCQPSVLTLRSRSDPAQVLAGYDVYTRPPDSKQPVLLGRTDRRGRVRVPPVANPLRVLLIRNGGELLARLPVVPGLEPELTAEVTDDDQRLEAEGIITGLQEEMVDLVTRREVLFARTRARIKDGKFDDAEKLLRELRGLPTRSDFALALAAQQKRAFSDDATAQAKIDTLFGDTRKLLQKHLDPEAIEALHEEVRRARASAGRQAPAGGESGQEAPQPQG